ncbi:MAG: GntR family transcriptional regulator [Microbacteriaceae bacterium]|nr:GntR family transcriptional regulator [Microbacteriaceae bacterium]
MNGSRPRYQAIEEWLTEQCKSLPPGSLLPSEPELALQFSVSRMTARQAVQNLAKSGLVERRQGAGTFVAPPLLHRREGVLLSFTEDMRRRGMKSSSRLLTGEVVISPEDAIALGLQPSSWVVRLERVRFADEMPLAIERVFLPGEFSAVLDYDLEHGSLHDALRDMGRQISHAHGYVTARLATSAEAEILGLTTPAPLLVESRTIYDTVERPVERTETCYVASRWVIDTGTYALGSMETTASSAG